MQRTRLILFARIMLSVLAFAVYSKGSAKAERAFERPAVTEHEGEAGSRHSADRPYKKGGVAMGKNQLTNEEGTYLLRLARTTIEKELHREKKDIEPETTLPDVFRDRRGTFVTLTMDGNLRGCIGHIVPKESVVEGIQANAINAAFRDPRFPPLTRDEWKRVSVEISILTDPEPLSYTDGDDLLQKLRSGVDGVIIKRGYHQATFLPQVWEQLPDKKDFLAHLCVKAGLDAGAWQKGDLDVSTYQVQAFEE